MHYSTMVAAAALAVTIVSAAADEVTYDDCREIVAIHSFLLEARKGCSFDLEKETSDLAYRCIRVLSRWHADLAVTSGTKTAISYREEHGEKTCNRVRDDFYPLIDR